MGGTASLAAASLAASLAVSLVSLAASLAAASLAKGRTCFPVVWPPALHLAPLQPCNHQSYRLASGLLSGIVPAVLKAITASFHAKIEGSWSVLRITLP